MNNDQGKDGMFKLTLFVAAGVTVYLVIMEIVAAIARFLYALVTMGIVATAVMTTFWLYKQITDKQYGHQKRVRQIEKLERERRETIARLPRHMREHADQYFKDKQQGLYELNPHSRLDVFIERTKKWFGKKGGEE